HTWPVSAGHQRAALLRGWFDPQRVPGRQFLVGLRGCVALQPVVVGLLASAEEMSVRTYSFEFFPPKTPEGTVKLGAVRAQLAALNPQYFSVTFGAGGSTREGTWNAVLDIHGAGLPAAPHVSCVGSPRASISKLLSGYREAGIRRLVALRGDAPSGTGTG